MNDLKPYKGWQILLLNVVFTFIASAVILIIARPPKGYPIHLSPTYTPSPLIIYLSGEVLNPGIYTLPQGSRIQDVIQQSGGLSGDADISSINLASRIYDGQHIIIPSFTQSQITDERNVFILTPDVGSFSIDNPLDINSATAEQLQQLPGIGPTKANAIIAYRESIGKFLSIEDLLFVSGIGENTFLQLKDIIIVINP